MIKPIKGAYMIVGNKTGFPAYETIDPYWAKNSRKIICNNTGKTWKELYKLGWRCKRVDIHITEVE